MRKQYLVLDEDDFGRLITLSRSTDLLSCEGEADNEATCNIMEGSRMTYVFELKQVYAPRPKEPTKEVEVVYVDQGE